MSIWELSRSVSVLIIWVLFVRLIGKKHLNKRVIVILWNLVLLRALIPIQIPIEKLPFLSTEITYISYPEAFLIPQKFEFSNQLFTSQTSIPLSGRIEKYALAIWLAGAVGTGLMMFRRSRLEIHAIRKTIPVECEQVEKLIKKAGIHRKIRVYTGRGFQSPVTCGAIRPKIILPEDFEKESDIHKRNMILHELEHIRRFDVYKRICMSITVCVHWFNPLIWISARLYKKDQEMACDERVLRSMSYKNAREYAATLICMSAKKEKEAVIFEGFQRKNAERERILAAIENRKMGIGGMLAAMVLVTVSMASFAHYAPTVEGIPVQAIPNTGDENSIGEKDKKAKVKEMNAEAVQDEEGKNRKEWLDMVARYRVIWEDIIENVNDPNAWLSEEQREAYGFYLEMDLANQYLERLDQGIGLPEGSMDMLEKVYPDRHYIKKN